MYLQFHITLQTPPANLTYALQKGSGSKYEMEQAQHSDGSNLHFNLAAEVKGTPQTHLIPDFKGPFVQGPLGGRFIYLDIGTYAGAANQWSGRLKIPLYSISWDTIDAVLANPAATLKTTVAGTGKNGTPNCATVKPFEGWRLTSQ